jgi:hypothetical protein
MNQIRRYAGFLALLVIIALAALLVREYMDKSQPIWAPPSPIAPTSTPAPAPSVTITTVRGMAELATVEYQAVAEVPNERVPDDVRQYLGVKEQILLIAYGDVKAGFRLEKLTGSDLWTDGSRVQLHLPAPEILSTSIDHKRSHVVTYQGSLLLSHDVNLEKDTLGIAEGALEQAAIDAKILENASKYGQLFFENFLRSLGFTEVKVIVN